MHVKENPGFHMRMHGQFQDLNLDIQELEK